MWRLRANQKTERPRWASRPIVVNLVWVTFRSLIVGKYDMAMGDLLTLIAIDQIKSGVAKEKKNEDFWDLLKYK